MCSVAGILEKVTIHINLPREVLIHARRPRVIINSIYRILKIIFVFFFFNYPCLYHGNFNNESFNELKDSNCGWSLESEKVHGTSRGRDPWTE